jgi:hypothetical protein
MVHSEFFFKTGHRVLHANFVQLVMKVIFFFHEFTD